MLGYRGLDGPTKPTGMIVWGILLVLAAAGFGCITVATPLAMMAPGPQQLPVAQFVGLALTYIVFGGGCLVLGIGCITFKRWTRKIMLVLAWMGLLMTMLTIPVTLASAATIDLGPGVQGGGRIAAISGVVFASLLGIGVPLAAILYFRRPDLEQRLVAIDPRPTWTDPLPLRVLALTLLSAFTAISFGLAAFTAVTPLYGTILRGPPAAVLLIVEAGLLATGAWLLIKNRIGGWRIALGMALFTLTSQLVTIAVLGGETVGMAAVTPQQADAVRGSPMLRTDVQIAMNLISLVVSIGVLLWIRPFVGKTAESN
ncbi:MAG: hypothetical protein AAF561_04060 [Planctomycetota bacterium]